MQSWISVLGVLGATFCLMSLAVREDVRWSGDQGRVSWQSPVPARAPARIGAAWVVSPGSDATARQALAAVEHSVLSAALMPGPVHQARVQLEKARAASHRVPRVSLRIPYYAFGPARAAEPN